MPEADSQFNKRVDAFIDLCNTQMNEFPQPTMVATSATYAAAQFTVWVVANTTLTAAEFKARREATIDAFSAGYRALLEQHYDDLAQNYDKYLNHKPGVTTR